MNTPPHHALISRWDLTNRTYQDWRQFSLSDQCQHPISAIRELNSLRNIGDTTFSLDGGFGEMFRRAFLNKLLFKHKGRGIPPKSDFISAIRDNKPRIFNADQTLQMTRGLEQDVDDLYMRVSSYEHLGLENWADAIALHSRLINLYSSEQKRLDSYLISLMPFVQARVLRHLFAIPVSLRKGSKLFKSIIKQRNKKLTRYPLVKSNIAYPFWLPMNLASGYMFLLRKLKSNDVIDEMNGIYQGHLRTFMNENGESKQSQSIWDLTFKFFQHSLQK